MKQFAILTTIILLLIPKSLLSQIDSLTAIANSVEDFSTTQSQNNWEYGYSETLEDVNTFMHLTNIDGSKWGDYQSNNTPYLDRYGGHPGIDSYELAVRRWTSNSSGKIVCQGNFYDMDASCGNGAYVRIAHNGIQVFESQNIPNTSTSYYLELDIRVGDILDFAIDPNGDATCDATYFTAHISKLNFRINDTSTTIFPVACGNYITLSGDETYYSSGIYSDTIPSASGNDSILTVDLTILNSDSPECGIYIPDERFEYFLIENGYDNNGFNHYISKDDANTVTYLLMNRGDGIKSLEGIKEFENLYFLAVINEQLTNLDVSGLTNLRSLRCYGNQLTSLNVTDCFLLDTLWCFNNNIPSLDVSSNTLLKTLRCTDNNLTSLITSGADSLLELRCENNNLSSIDVSQNKHLQELRCDNNQINKLDLSQNQKLRSVSCINNSLTCLNIQNGNNKELAGFQAYNNPLLVSIQVDNVSLANSNDYPYNSWNKDDATSYTTLSCELYNGNVVFIPDPNFEQALIDLGIDSEGVLDQQILRSDAEAVSGQLFVASKSISDLTGIEAFVNITGLSCYKNQLTTVDISHNTALTSFSCYENLLNSLDVSQNKVLKSLVCTDNQISALDVSNNTQLELLNITRNNIATLDLSNNTALKRIYCETNQLTALDVSNQPFLEEMFCSQNGISSLNVSQNPQLNWLVTNSNSLTKLDVSANPLLTGLFCFNNQIASIDLSNNPLIYRLNVGRNLITELYLAKNDSLEMVLCGYNQIESLDVRNGNNSILTSLNATNNKLSCISVDNEKLDYSHWIVDPTVSFSNDCNNNTQKGDIVEVLLVVEGKEQPVKTTFEKVLTTGETTVELKDETPEEPVLLPEGFKTLEPSLIYEIKTTAEIEPVVEVEIGYKGLEVEKEEALYVGHATKMGQTFNMLSSVVKLLDQTVTGVSRNYASPFIIVEDVQAPVFVEISDIEVDADPGEPGAIVYFDTPTAKDNSPDEVIISQIDATGLSSGSFFPIGITTLSFEAKDRGGNAVTANLNITVKNPAPVILGLDVPQEPIALGTSTNVTIEYDDDNLETAVIDWGDDSGLFDGVIDGNMITFSYEYPSAGVYELILTLTDLGDEVADTSHQYIVVYDPNGGFVTGGGWIWSPNGAYISDPTLEGKANFGFVAKYKKGTTVPDGNTEFQFKAGDLNFTSASYDWLVVAGEKAKFKGNGTINSLGDFSFMLSAVDGDIKDIPDMFRIKIWETSTEIVVYDNQLGDSDDSDATDAIEGGSITVHTPKLKSTQDIEIVNELSITNYPNPFNGKTTIEFAIPEKGNVSIMLYDHIGREVSTILYQEKPAGKHTVEFDGTGFQQGIYFYKLMYNTTSITKKMVLQD